MAGQPGFFDQDERLQALSAAGDPLERLAAVVDFEMFRSDLIAALSRSERAKGGRPPYDPVLMFKVLVLQTLYTLSDDQTEYPASQRLAGDGRPVNVGEKLHRQAGVKIHHGLRWRTGPQSVAVTLSFPV
jgi:Transposase domain (DUF772)